MTTCVQQEAEEVFNVIFEMLGESAILKLFLSFTKQKATTGTMTHDYLREA